MNGTKAVWSLVLALLVVLAPTQADAQMPEHVVKLLERDLKMRPAQVKDYDEILRSKQNGAARIRERLGDNFGGSWLEQSANGDFLWIVGTKGVLPTEKQSLKKTDPRYKKVRFSVKELESARDKLQSAVMAQPAGHGFHYWVVSQKENAVVISAMPSAKQNIDRVLTSTLNDTGVVKIVWDENGPVPALFGGGADPNNFCSIAFNATRNGVRGFLTAGHCYAAGTDMGPTTVATVQLSSYTVVDAVVDGSHSDMAWAQLNSAAEPDPAQVTIYSGNQLLNVVGQQRVPEGSAICRYGRTTGARCGIAGPIGATVIYGPQQVLFGMGIAQLCAAGGDSGGAYISPTGEAQGITSGVQNFINSGEFGNARHNCHLSPWSISFYQPLQPVLDRWNLTIRTVASCGRLNPGNGIGSGGTITSCNGLWRLGMQGDGNLVLRHVPSNAAYWWSGASGWNSSLWMQNDGNLVTYNESSQATWWTGTNWTGNALFVSDGGDVIIKDLWGNPRWYVCAINGPGAHPSSLCYTDPGGNAQ